MAKQSGGKEQRGGQRRVGLKASLPDSGSGLHPSVASSGNEFHTFSGLVILLS